MIEAGTLITAKEAERRVLILENPGLRGQSKITTDLYAGVQLVLPGEVAPAHRHSQSALRFVLEGDGAHTAVNGERTPMRYGDFVITPSMAWHDHGNETDQPMFWLDGLDIPIVQFLDASFAEHTTRTSSRSRAPSAMHARYGSNLLPVDQGARLGRRPCSTIRTAARATRWRSSPAARLGIRATASRCATATRVTGGYPMATIGAFIQLLPRGFQTARYRSTDATIFVAVEGRGKTRIGADFVVEWGPRDIFVVPSWKPVVHEATDEAVLFSFSDRPVQEALQLFREDRHSA